MNANDSTTDLHDLRRSIAERLGVTLAYVPYADIMGFLPCDALGYMVFVATTPEGYKGYSQMSESRALDEAGVPNWPSDLGAALVLCLDVARRHPGSMWRWDITIAELETLSKFRAQFTTQPSDVYAIGTGRTPAEALSRLALAALSCAPPTHRNHIGGNALPRLAGDWRINHVCL
jgi:hypothetical protein